MKITLRLTLSLLVAVAVVAIGSAYLQVHQDRRQLQNELEGRARLLALELKDDVAPILAAGSPADLQGLAGKLGRREKLYGLALYDSQGKPLGTTQGLGTLLSSVPRAVTESLAKEAEAWEFDRVNGRRFHVYAMPVLREGALTGAVVVVHDAAYIQRQLSRIWVLTFERVLVQMILISLVTLVVVRWSITGAVTKLAAWMKRVRSGGFDVSAAAPKADLFEPIAAEVKTMVRHLSAAKTAAEMEARLRQARESIWTPERLKESVKGMLKGRPLFVVSNREPYMHVHRERKMEVVVPPGGLVTALEPVLRAAGGTWIAHGSGDADFDVVDERNRIRVPPDDPLYTLKRVALTKKEEEGYYYGFANEGLWPLCHIAHTRPTFRTEDWEEYKEVNQKFAWIALEEMKDVDDPCILIQDYHFALLPRMIKDKRSDARIAIFWHIPWPSPEAIGICPWQKEILWGMIGADLVGFQTQYFCNNFLDTVDRTLETRIDWERFAVRKEGMTTLVKPFPISVAFPGAFLDVFEGEVNGRGKAAILRELAVSGRYLGVGVDRMDYTKGILERFRAVERFLEKHEAFIGEFVFVQLGAPSRTPIKRYQEFLAEVDREVARINGKFKGRDWRPIVYLKKVHSHKEILPFYKNADLCMVTSLHDGMNLVAKEFVAERDDEDGVLILSRFTGAARELRDALIVNPYDIDQMADAIRHALEMSPEERAARMHRMRETVRVHNIYRWAGTLIEELVNIRVGGRTAAQD
jgi:alpha,alpha-trehalose-phosphate synthase [UDP-forming]